MGTVLDEKEFQLFCKGESVHGKPNSDTDLYILYLPFFAEDLETWFTFLPKKLYDPTDREYGKCKMYQKMETKPIVMGELVFFPSPHRFPFRGKNEKNFHLANLRADFCFMYTLFMVSSKMQLFIIIPSIFKFLPYFKLNEPKLPIQQRIFYVFKEYITPPKKN